MSADETKPTVGRIVNYYPRGDIEQSNGALFHPAIVTRVFDSGVNLTVFPDLGTPYTVGTAPRVMGYGGGLPGHWDWPSRD